MRETATAWNPKYSRTVSALLAAIAGYVDSCTFLGLFGLFVAQVTGSFVVAGAWWVAHDPGFLVKVLGIPFFLLGGVLTTLLAAAASARGRSPLFWTFGLEGVLVFCFLAIGIARAPFSDPNGSAELVAAFLGLSAMGVQSATVRLLMNGVASTNVMTTNTTLIAIEATRMMLAWRGIRVTPGDGDVAVLFATKRHEVLDLLLIVAGFLAGTIFGAIAFGVVSFWSLLLPTVATLSLAAWTLMEQTTRTSSAT